MSDAVNMPEPDSAEWASGQLLTPFDELLEGAFGNREVQEALRDPALSASDLRTEIVDRRHELLLTPSRELRELVSATGELFELTAPPTQTEGYEFAVSVGVFGFRLSYTKLVDRVARFILRVFTRRMQPQVGETVSRSDERRMLREAEARLEVARRAYTDVVFEKGIQRLLRSLIDERTESSYSTTLAIDAAPGLAELTREEPGVLTPLAQRLRRTMRGMGGGSIGISGPRGIGKTTLLEAFILSGERLGEDDERRPPLPVLVSAPVAYDGRDFVLYLFAELCEKLLESAGVGVKVRPRDGPNDEASFWLRLLLVLPPLALGAAFAGAAVLFVNALSPNDAAQRGFLVGAGVLAGAIGILVGLAPALLSEFGGRPARLQDFVTQALIFIGVLGIAIGSILIALAALGDHLSTTTQRALFAVIVGFATAMLALRIRQQIVFQQFERNKGSLGLAWGMAGDDMVPIAYAWRERIRFQQRYTTGWSGGLIAPFGLEATRSGRKDATEQQLTFPDAVAALRRFIAQIATTRDVLIAIDELDKMESPQAANRFLNEIKAIFRIERCFYLVSVSEDAMSQFERRGMPLRDVFDSSFDEVVYLEHLKVDDSRRLLGERVIGLPVPFLFLAHCMSAGLPRDLIRVARDVIDVRVRHSGPVPLSDVCRQIVHSELSRKARASIVIARGIGLEPHASGFLGWVEGLGAHGLGSADLLTRCETAQDFIVENLPNLADGGERAELRQLERSQLVELTVEMALVAYFGATLLDFFCEPLGREELRHIEHGERGESAIELLARARQSFGVNRMIAWSLISRFRHVVSLSDGPPFPSILFSGHLGPTEGGRTVNGGSSRPESLVGGE